jgi:hypothetical protein
MSTVFNKALQENIHVSQFLLYRHSHPSQYACSDQTSVVDLVGFSRIYGETCVTVIHI